MLTQSQRETLALNVDGHDGYTFRLRALAAEELCAAPNYGLPRETLLRRLGLATDRRHDFLYQDSACFEFVRGGGRGRAGMGDYVRLADWLRRALGLPLPAARDPLAELRPLVARCRNVYGVGERSAGVPGK